MWGIELPVTHTVGDPMRALTNAALKINPNCINLKDYPHVRRLFMDAHSLLKDKAYAERVTSHRSALRDAPTEDCFDALVEAFKAEWLANGEHAFARKVSNLIEGPHKHWFRGVAEIGGQLRFAPPITSISEHRYKGEWWSLTVSPGCSNALKVFLKSLCFSPTGLIPCTQAHERQNREDKEDGGCAMNGHLYNIRNNFSRYVLVSHSATIGISPP